MINQLIYHIITASLISSTLAILFIFQRKAVIKYIGATWNYYLWFTVYIPWIIIWFPYHLLPATTPPLKTIIQSFNPTPSAATDSNHLTQTKIFFIIWLIGIVSCLFIIVLKHIQFSLMLKKYSKPITKNESDIIKQLLMNTESKYLSRIYLSSAIGSPMLCHAIKPKIYLPKDFFQHYSNTEQKYVLQHEYVHLKRNDLFANVAMIMLCCVNWFNPIMFFAYRHFRNAQELSCDAIVSQRLSPNEKKAYGYALLKTVISQSSSMPAMSCGWNTQNQLKERCQMLKFHHFKPTKLILGIVTLLIVTCAAIAAPNLERREIKTLNPSISYSADAISQSTNGKKGMLSGNVQLSIDNRVKISADKVLVKYTDDKKPHVSAFIIYGKGLLEDGHRTMQFVNGTFNPDNFQLSAESIHNK